MSRSETTEAPGRHTNVLRNFIRANRTLSDRVVPYLPQAKNDPRARYSRVVAAHMNEQRDSTIVVDVGGGKRCDFACYKAPEANIMIIAVDIDPDELAHNQDVDEKRVADITEGLPFPDGEADLIVSRSVLEHLRNVEAFVADAHRVLKPGGYFVHLLPSKFSPVSIANQLLPNELARRIIHLIIPGSAGRLGFPAYYDRCYPTALERVLSRHGFEIDALHLGYHQRDYFDFFFPLFVVNALYELLVYSARVRNLCAVMLVVARKPASVS